MIFNARRVCPPSAVDEAVVYSRQNRFTLACDRRNHRALSFSCYQEDFQCSAWTVPLTLQLYWLNIDWGTISWYFLQNRALKLKNMKSIVDYSVNTCSVPNQNNHQPRVNRIKCLSCFFINYMRIGNAACFAVLLPQSVSNGQSWGKYK